MSVGLLGGADRTLGAEEVAAFVHEQLAGVDLDDRSVCVLVPDATRTCPLPSLLDAVLGAIDGRASRITVLVALGTHPPLGDEALAAHLGVHPGDGAERRSELVVANHEWWDDDTFRTVGTVPGARVAELSGGRLRDDVTVRINRAVVDHDVTLVVGPVFPHEVVGFSGGDKYLFPGVSGPEMIDVSHWLGALIGSAEVIGTPGTTPVRALIDEAAALVPGERHALCVVTRPGGTDLATAAFGPPGVAWAAAAEVSAAVHVRRLAAPVPRVLSIVPERYRDLWTGAKGFYKVEPVVADGGEVVILAPHIKEISAAHPAIREIGYHSRDYFLGQWDRFSHHRWGDLAHSTHLRGAGTWNPVDGERPRVRVTLATGILAEEVRAVGLDHADPGAIDVAEWEADPDALVVHDAGEQLYRLA